MKLKLPISFALILICGLFILTTESHAQENVSLGCCKTVEGTPKCVGCGEGGSNCAVDGSLCVETNQFDLGQICIQSTLASQAECRPPEGNGCCVEEVDKCTDNVSFNACKGQHWFEASACSSVAMCTPAAPTALTDKIVIVLAILIVIALLVFFRRKRPAN